MNNKIIENYSSLVSLAKRNKLDLTHGLFQTYKGHKTDARSILFVGRDTNGIKENIESHSGNFSFEIEELTWLKGGYSYKNSPFLRVMGKISSKIRSRPYEYDSYKEVYWSNLFKISPTKRRKTSVKNKRLQRSDCIQLLTNEISFLNPAAIVFLTGDEIEPFLTNWGDNNIIKIMERNTEYYLVKFEFHNNGKSIPAIAFNHPQNKKQYREDFIITEAVDMIGNSRT